jgi:hypothetical protein
VQRILIEGLHMRRVSAKFVPRLLRDDQKENRMNVCRDLKSEVQNDSNFLKRIVTGAHSLFLVVAHLTNRQRVKTGTQTTEHH